MENDVLQVNYVSGFRTDCKRELVKAENFLNLAKSVGSGAASYHFLITEALNGLVFCQNVLSRMTDRAERKGFAPIEVYNPSLNQPIAIDAVLDEIVFIKGAINDPYFHDSDFEFQQGAKLNIIKAWTLLDNRIEWARKVR